MENLLATGMKDDPLYILITVVVPKNTGNLYKLLQMCHLTWPWYLLWSFDLYVS